MNEDDLHIRAVVEQAFNDAVSEVKKENPYTGTMFLLAEFESVFLTKCWQSLSSEEEYAAVERWWIAFRDVTLFAD